MSDNPPAEKPKAGAESPTTARELDFDDEVQESASATPSKPNTGASPKPRVAFVEDEEAAPAKPPRPMSPRAQAEHTLIEAFPNIDVKVIKAILTASGGKVEPAFNALLGMSDPDFKEEEAPPPQPPRPAVTQRQLDADEMYARQLAEHFQSSSRPQRGGGDDRGPPLPTRPGMSEENREHSFFDDDLPVIRENVRKGFIETQSKVNQWISDFRKRIDGDEDDPYRGPPRMESPPRRQNFGPSQTEQMYGIRKSAETGRKSTDRDRYDADPHVLDDDLTTLELRDDEGMGSGRRPLNDPELFKTGVAPPQSGPVDEVDAADRKIQRSASPNSAAKSAKWQPLTSIAPKPESEENDPFSLGDSEDEKETDKSKGKDIKEEDTARLKEAARKSISGESGEAVKTLEASERSGSVGTKDKEAEEILTGKKSS
ncbi:hypothetical protein AAFC00_005399 [Neodothiora populina]|uniref:CUE domain-containing protein n=1 Tax=Neodothiora populina TaxID=2781224 RepID=A0ABR3PKR7_9PEZI